MFKTFEEFVFENELVGSEEMISEQELSALQKEYQEYFKEVLAKYEVDSPAKLDDEKKKEFFAEIKSGWTKGEGRK